MLNNKRNRVHKLKSAQVWVLSKRHDIEIEEACGVCVMRGYEIVDRLT